MTGITTGTALAITLAVSLAAAAASAASQYMQGQQQSKAAKANADIARENVDIQNQNALLAENQGANAASAQVLKARQANATLRASAGSSGLVADAGTLGGLQDQNTTFGEFNALTASNDAARQAWGYSVNASNFQNQANMDDFQASNANTNSYLNAGTTLVNGVGGALGSYTRAGGNFGSIFGSPNGAVGGAAGKLYPGTP